MFVGVDSQIIMIRSGCTPIGAAGGPGLVIRRHKKKSESWPKASERIGTKAAGMKSQSRDPVAFRYESIHRYKNKYK